MNDDMQAEKFISQHVKQLKPLSKAANLAYWNAATTGKAEDYDKNAKLKLKIRRIYSNSKDFQLVKQLKETGKIDNPITARQVKVLYDAYLTNQIEPNLLKQIVELETDIEKNFSTFRGTIDSKEVSSNDINEILKNETDSEKRKKAWLAGKQVGEVVADDIIRLVKLRNRAARKVGFDNFHTLTLETGEQDVKELDKLFDELEVLTRKPYTELKMELDKKLADRYGIGTSKIMPWHYHDPFFQEAPMVYDMDLDVYYKDRNIEKLSADFYDGIGLNVDSIIANSDLYERDGKNPHGFCTDIDKEGDVRILCNLKDNEKWMEVQLHELGHAVYAKYHDRDVPYTLRHPAHSFTTEGIAMLFGRLSTNTVWMQQMLELSDTQRQDIKKVSQNYARISQLIFARWVLVMYNFEKQLYADPDRNLNRLWWDMVEKYQFVKKPPHRDKSDWAAKIHFVMAPCYYHNYLLGEMLASQLHSYIVKNVLELESDTNANYVDQKDIGNYLRQMVFEVGSIYHWNEMIKQATGEELTPKYFIEDFVY